MKKIAGIAATLAMATAFCGFCAGVASNVTADAETTAPGVTASAATTTPKVILNPGAFYGNEIEASAAGKVQKLSSAEEGEYFVENAWFANYTAGEALPKATTTRSGVTFVGWRYAQDGETKIVTTMPTVTENLYLYAHWTAGTTSQGGDGGDHGGDGGDHGGNEGSEIALTGTSAAFKFNDATIVITLTAKASWGDKGSEEIFIGGTWNNTTRFKLDRTTHTINSNIPDFIYVGFTQYTTDGKYAKIPSSEFENGKVHTVTAVDYDSATGWEGDNWKYTLTKSDITYVA